MNNILAALFTDRYRKLSDLQIEVTTIRYRWASRDDTFTRAEVLRISTDNAKDFNLPHERHGDKVFVDLSQLTDLPTPILVIDASFLADLKRLRLVVKGGRLYAKTFRETAEGWKPHLCPLTSVIGAKKYGQEHWDTQRF